VSIIRRDQLQFTYSWSTVAPADPYERRAEGALLDPWQGHEMLAFLNDTCKTLQQAEKTERLLRDHLPAELRGRAEVLAWVQQAYLRY
jgi:hypothetical protein